MDTLNNKRLCQSMHRLIKIGQRYGWRTPFVTATIALGRLYSVLNQIKFLLLVLICPGKRGKNARLSWSVWITPGGHLDFGNNIFIGERCILEIGINPRGHLSIGDNTWISHDCHIQSCGRILIGDDVLIGEFVSIRDTSHQYVDSQVPIREQPDKIGSIVIESNVWIGRGTIIIGKQNGLIIGTGAIIGANSVITKSVQPNTIVGGVPARLIRNRF